MLAPWFIDEFMVHSQRLTYERLTGTAWLVCVDCMLKAER